MKRPLSLSGVLLLALLLSGCVTVTAPPQPEITSDAPPTDDSSDDSDDADDEFAKVRAMRCNGDSVVLKQNTEPVALVGDCVSVTIEGQNANVRIEQVTELIIRGDDNDVDVVEVGTVLINGQENDVEVTTSGITVLEIAGNDNSVSTPGDVGGVVVNGNDNDVEYRGTIDEKAENGTGNTFGND